MPRDHTDRLRAESFGSFAEEYDAHRPSYPAELIDDLAALRPEHVLDIGCGTGKAAVQLAARGLDVLGVELDARMAEVARGHGIRVEVAAFEEWEPAGRTFDLITCGQAWHWVDPARALPRVLDALNPGGTLALFWNVGVLRQPVAAALDAVYQEHAAELPRIAQPSTDDRPGADEIEADPGFESPAEIRRYHSVRADATDDWIATVRTHSDHATMPAERRETLLAAVAATIDGLGGTVVTDVETYTLLARRRGGAV